MFFKYYPLIWLTVSLFCVSLVRADNIPTITHHDPLDIDQAMTLAKLVDLTMEKFPDVAWLDSLEQEADAIKQRGNSWTAGVSQAGLRYQNMTSGTVHYVDATVQIPLWNMGQRSAEKDRGTKAERNAGLQSAAIKLRVAGLVRNALWDLELQKVRYEQAKSELDLYEKLLAKVERRVELGDLPRADVLLAQSELLQKLSNLNLAEAELMHARKRYSSITQINKMPSLFQESLSDLKTMQFNHPAFVAINSEIDRKQAEIKAAKLVGSGQTSLTAGINSDRTQNNDPRSNQTESFNIGVNIPFGGSEHLQPHLAALNVELNRLIADREQLYRNLELAHHEAEHNLEVNQAELEIATELKRVAEQHLAMMQLSFSVGEINLMDLLKAESRTQQAILGAKERRVMKDRDIALYNQAVGVFP